MDQNILEILRAYSRGEISAFRAAARIGGGANVGDIFEMMRQAEMPLPDPDGEFEKEFERAKKLFGKQREGASDRKQAVS